MMKMVFVIVAMIAAVVIIIAAVGYLISNMRSMNMTRWLKDWRFTVDYLSDSDECIEAFRRILGLVDGAYQKIDIQEPLGIAGAIYGSENNADGVIIEPVKVHRIERIGLRSPLDALCIVAWKLDLVREIYVVYTSAGVYYMRLCDCAHETKLAFDDMLEGASSFDEFQVEPTRAVLRVSLLQ